MKNPYLFKFSIYPVVCSSLFPFDILKHIFGYHYNYYIRILNLKYIFIIKSIFIKYFNIKVLFLKLFSIYSVDDKFSYNIKEINLSFQ